MIAFGFGSAEAQTLRNADQPAEFPPASYTGKQYVDSKGCVFVRAGFDGNVTWVPRVSRQRKVLCGFQPTLAGTAQPEAAPAPAPPPRVASAPVPKPAPAPVVAAPSRTAPPPQRVVSAPPAETPRVTPPPRAVAAPRPAPVQAPPPRVVVQQPRATVATACPDASPTSRVYLRSTPGFPVRCGPQPDHPAQYVPRGSVPHSSAAPEVLRVPPPPKIAPPPGYRAAFDEDRFNPNRGRQTREGFAQMRLIWTSGVPRRLVDQNTGRDVTRLFPGLRFPFISLTQQKKYVAVHGWPAESGVTVAAKNTPPAATAAPTGGAGHRYVQVGTFGVPANADASAARLRALGLPVRIGTYRKKGKTYRVVLAGPFNSSGQLQSALSAARRGGFPDAFPRK